MPKTYYKTLLSTLLVLHRVTYGKGVTAHLTLTYITAGIFSTIVRRVRASILQEGGRASETSLSILDVE